MNGRPSMSSMVLSIAACEPMPVWVMSPPCEVGAICAFGTGRSSSYQMNTPTVPALYAALSSTGWMLALAQASTVALLQSWPSLHRLGVMNANVGKLLALNSLYG